MNVLRAEIEKLNPAYFAMVMATGIVAISAHLLGMGAIARGLTWLNIGLFAALWLATITRLVCFPRAFLADFLDHRRGVGFFTVVAGTCVLGSQLLLIDGNHRAATALWLAGLALWLGLTYAIFTGFTVKETKPTLAEGMTGGWLVSVVSTQAVSNLGGLLAPRMPFPDVVLFLTLVLWLCGAMLYIWIISLIFYRYTFFTFSPSDLNPPYWINMGAMAISTLAGATLIDNASHSPLLTGLLPFLKGFTILFWATATWWIPMLVILGVWRHLYKKFKLAYEPLYWGAVFPLGMYTTCTFRLAKTVDLPFLLVIPKYFLYIALLAWLAAFLGWVRRISSVTSSLMANEPDSGVERGKSA